jgi:hypothetical protein
MPDINENYAIGLSENLLANEMPEVERIVTLATADKYPLAAAAQEKGKPADSVFRWGAYKRPEKASKPVVDGYRTVPKNYEQATQVYSLTEELRSDWKITRRTEAVQDYFNESNPSVQMRRALDKLQMMKENVFGSLQIPKVGTLTQGQQTRGLLEMLLPSTVTLTGDNWQPFPNIAKLRTAAYSNKALSGDGAYTLDDLRTQLAAVAKYYKGDVNLMCFCGSAYKSLVTSFVWYDQVNSGPKPNVIQYRRGDKSEPVSLYVDILKTDFGELRVVTDYYLGVNTATGEDGDFTDGAAVMIDPSMLFTRTLQPLRHTAAEEQGQGKGGFYSVDVGLAYRFPARAALVLPGASSTIAPPNPESEGPDIEESSSSS